MSQEPLRFEQDLELLDATTDGHDLSDTRDGEEALADRPVSHLANVER
jgi:hypothetical protein